MILDIPFTPNEDQTSDDAHFQDLRWFVEEKKECLYMDTSYFVACREVACTCTKRLVFEVPVSWSTSLGLGCRMNYQCCKPHFWQKQYFTIRTNKQKEKYEGNTFQNVKAIFTCHIKIIGYIQNESDQSCTRGKTRNI